MIDTAILERLHKHLSPYRTLPGYDGEEPVAAAVCELIRVVLAQQAEIDTLKQQVARHPTDGGADAI